jgi:hypothetical protein
MNKILLPPPRAILKGIIIPQDWHVAAPRADKLIRTSQYEVQARGNCSTRTEGTTNPRLKPGDNG